ncbi:hypothetical protein CHLNCDRAFT_54899 [Chlorella variabilis]|uniref:UBC core domain-containing protein n=1 Tax=Chlorella variabilis TaxID=554065 RepID=E1ZR10_CHLVA|nr:hypothetical protein CHLNCDRAFT_54899 [Chlorella variabilis]EFN51646.1 hypothetical protein CHLNCDRAFT_54899 [Chlorella variabilis]|eukprot:XP_005843748.1 hypothetical protein CHLNCDRAFT_54899 [Chlorella variabilis]
MARHVAIRRLLNDLKEVLEHPQPDAAALPTEDDLMVWHANLRTQEGPLAGLALHALLLFSDDYPARGPAIRLFHALPHPNIALHLSPSQQCHGASYRVALWNCNPSLDQWNPAYSVLSTLALLSSFLFDPDLLYDARKISFEAATRAAAGLDLKGHPHTGALPFPPFPTPEQASLAPRLRLMDVRRPPVNRDLMSAHSEVQPLKATTVKAATLTAATPKAGPHGGEVWTLVSAKRGVKASVADMAASAADPTAALASSLSLSSWGPASSGFDLLSGLEEEREEEEEEGGHTSEEEEPEEEAAAPTTESGIQSERLLDPSILEASHTSLIGGVMALHHERLEAQLGERAARLALHADAIRGAADHRVAAVEGASAGPAFDVLTPDALAQVLLRMEARDVAALGATCRGLRAACGDGEVWHALLHRAFPASALRCCALADYRVAYELEASGAVPELSCFFSRASFETEVLGFAYQFTVNPKTGAADYIMPTSPDLVAVEAVAAGLVARDAGGTDIQGAIPAYITQDHFHRALPFLPRVLRQLCPAHARPGPEQWLTVLPTMLNTCAVLLADHGTAASERALNTYCGLHRLLLALCDHHGLWERAEQRLQRFLSCEAHRTKSQAPSLGNLVPLLAVSRQHDWRQVLPVVLSEAVDRQVLWVCKADRTMVSRYKVPPRRGGVDAQLMQVFFEASAVSLRLLMFHAAFLSLVARPRRQSIGEVMYRLDSSFGRPGAGLRRRFQAAVQQILECDSLDQALQVMGMVRMSPEAWTGRLRQSWLKSLAKGYHTPRTKWDRIQARGVSRILLRGQQYSAPPNLAAIEVDERWHSKTSDDFTYLDASCLVYGRRRGAPQGATLELLEAIDYSNTRSTNGAGAVRHSGDMVHSDSGQHTITISLRSLPPRVEALYLTMSAWAGKMLTDIDQPYIRYGIGYHMPAAAARQLPPLLLLVAGPG